MGDTEQYRPLMPSVEGASGSEPPGDPSSRRKYARAACANCKKRKLKCTGGPPCDNCNKKGVACEVNEEGDQRRKQGLKRKVDTLQDKGKLLDRLVFTLQELDANSGMQIMNLIRSHASLEEVESFMEDLLRKPTLEKTPDLVEACEDLQRWNRSQKKAMLAKPDPKELADIVLFKVPAAPWTSVTSDDGLVSHLISLWFTWVHPFLSFIDRDLFIRDMKSGNLDSHFCSPFLVNVMLADACAYSDYPGVFAVSSEAWSRGLHFYKEAKRLLDEAEGRLSVSLVAGLGVLYIVSVMIGKDRAGHIYLGQLTFAVEELAQKQSSLLPNADEDTRQNTMAVDNMIWGLFNMITMTSLAFNKGALMKIPQNPRPQLQDAHRDMWCNYPRSSENFKSHRQCLVDSYCNLSIIEHELSWNLFGGKKPMLTVEFAGLTEAAYERLISWYKDLPRCLGLEDAPPPHIISFHLKYHTMIQTIFGLLKTLPMKENSDYASDGDSDDDTSSEWETSVRQHAQQTCLDSARESAKLVNLTRDLWGLENVPPMNVHWTTVSLLNMLAGLGDKDNWEPFVTLCIAAKAHANHWGIGRATLRLVQVTAKQMGVDLPPETEALFKEFETKVWSAEDRKVISSQYPNYARPIKRGEMDEHELDAFLDKFDDLYVAENDVDDTRDLQSPRGSIDKDGSINENSSTSVDENDVEIEVQSNGFDTEESEEDFGDARREEGIEGRSDEDGEDEESR